MEDEKDADDAIRRLDRAEFGRKGRRLRVEWTKVTIVICLARRFAVHTHLPLLMINACVTFTFWHELLTTTTLIPFILESEKSLFFAVQCEIMILCFVPVMHCYCFEQSEIGFDTC